MPKAEDRQGEDPLIETYKDLKRKRDKAARQIAYYQGRLRAVKAQLSKKSKMAEKQRGEESSSFEESNETIFAGPVANLLDKNEKPLSVDRSKEFNRTKGLHVTKEKPKRYQAKVTVEEITYIVETVTDPITGKTVRASTKDEGPEGFQITWVCLSTLIKLAISFAIPINRISKMIHLPGTPFGTSQICRMLNYAAKGFLPVYLHLSESLADVDILAGDDSPTKVLEGEAAETDFKSEVEPPKKKRLTEKIGEFLGAAFSRADGKGMKKKLNISLVTGKMVPEDRRSNIYFFRTHRGSVGNLISKILESRLPKNKKLIVQGDLSSTNLVKGDVTKKFDISYAGCGAHARRPFWRYKDQDQDFCFFMLRGFLLLSEIEDRIQLKGYSPENILKLRGFYGNMIWTAMKNRCIAAVTGKPPTPSCIPPHYPVPLRVWPPGSVLYRAAKYVIDHYDSLTLYLKDPRLSLTNNKRERLLRGEKLLLLAAKFRKTFEGRTVFDILRTIVHTCAASEVELTDYVKFVLNNEEDVKNNPAKYTPYAYSCLLRAKATQ